jgi:glutathione S-transferase
MITLCGFPVSNYYNKVKMAMLEKGVSFTEEIVKTGSKDEAVLSVSPLGKVPFIKTPQGGLSESQAIMDYLELAYPATPLMPADPFARAKVGELCTYLDWHVEIAGRELYGAAYFGSAPLSDDTKASVRKRLDKSISALKRLVKFSPFIAGDTLTQADCSAYATFPAVGNATKIIYGEDLFVANGLDYKPYMKMLSERPSVQRVAADRKASLPPA